MGKREEFFDRRIKLAATTDIKDLVADGASSAADAIGGTFRRGAELLLPGGSARARAEAESKAKNIPAADPAPAVDKPSSATKQTASGAWEWANKPLYDTGNTYGNIATSPVGIAGGLTAAAALYWLLKKRRRMEKRNAAVNPPQLNVNAATAGGAIGGAAGIGLPGAAVGGALGLLYGLLRKRRDGESRVGAAISGLASGAGYGVISGGLVGAPFGALVGRRAGQDINKRLRGESLRDIA